MTCGDCPKVLYSSGCCRIMIRREKDLLCLIKLVI
jgi:hypothetical protein